jgi:hypothetical protein
MRLVNERALIVSFGVAFAAGAFALTQLASCAGASLGGLGAAAAEDPRCAIDAVKICESARGGPVTIGGQRADRTMVEQLGARTLYSTIPLRDESGEVIANVSCQINAQYQTVVYASASAGPPLTDKSVEFLRARGLCKN